MNYDIYSIGKKGDSICHLSCLSGDVDEKLEWLKEKYPNRMLWIFGIDVRLRKGKELIGEDKL